MPKPCHVHETYIRTTPERLWSALTDPADTERYYFGCRFEGALGVGEPYRMVGESGDVIEGTVVELVPQRRLVVTFRVLFDPEATTEAPSRVTWEITPLGATVCRVSLVHDDFGSPSKTWSITRSGWPIILDGLKTLIETGEPIGEILDDRADVAISPVDLTGEEHRERGIEIYNEVWRYIGLESRTPEDDEAMIRAAYASAYHWSLAARRTSANEARSEWQLSRVHVLVGRGEDALRHARRCLVACEAGGLVDFDLGYAHEAQARALALLGRAAEAAAELAIARATEVVDPEDRQIYESDLESGPWFGVAVTPAASG